MNNLLSLMEEFSILGMGTVPPEDETTLSLASLQGANPSAELAPQGGIPPVDEYELDAQGNPVLDAQGNPVKKVLAPTDVASPSSCTCAHGDAGVPAAPLGSVPPALAPAGIAPPIVPEDEFDFNL